MHTQTYCCVSLACIPSELLEPSKRVKSSSIEGSQLLFGSDWVGPMESLAFEIHLALFPIDFEIKNFYLKLPQGCVFWVFF